MDFFLVRLVRTHCKRNYLILQYIITIFPIGESLGRMSKCCSMDVVEGELFRFQLLFINREIVLTVEPMFFYECSLVYFMIISTMSNECFHR